MRFRHEVMQHAGKDLQRPCAVLIRARRMAISAPMTHRRRNALAALAAAVLTGPVRAQQRQSLVDPLRLGVDNFVTGMPIHARL